MSDTIETQLSDTGVLTVAMNRPDSLNSLNYPLVMAVIEVFKQANENDDIRCLILTGNGRGFCAGADLSGGDFPRLEGKSHGETTWHNMDIGFNVMGRAIHDCDKPVICAVNGVAAGAGVGVALSGDLVIAAKSASFKLVFAPQLGIIPDIGASWLVPRLIGRTRANGLALLGDALPAQKAEEWGLVWQCVEDDALMDTAMQLAERLAAGAITGIKATSRAHDVAMTNTYDEQLDYERDQQGHFCDQPVFLEGARAFMEKRKPNFRDVETAQMQAARQTQSKSK
ncbi:MAG: enoyl-CoA hydratase [Rhodobiaceae bacterium]|jgi:2-(1,2-epoxy-1,2-dihydrophenyl)acetyl-CoA isomerase|nr:enoyl-CoA hydratase [Rhodobiaceae bacterium]MBT5517818.1 enoyl-CoA hydratase [Rhodobiaceae bacterium]MBT7279970.1 enoyl-CoA hydratase [Rhodobiaceae bacterium]